MENDYFPRTLKFEMPAHNYGKVCKPMSATFPLCYLQNEPITASFP
jgi:hypothetical protein